MIVVDAREAERVDDVEEPRRDCLVTACGNLLVECRPECLPRLLVRHALSSLRSPATAQPDADVSFWPPPLEAFAISPRAARPPTPRPFVSI
jgi:hypothetical protein